MMHYVISDIHGCLDKFKHLLEIIEFKQNDTLYVLGDCIDRGEDPIGVLKIMMMYDNIVPIIGNHEYAMAKLLPKLLKQISNANVSDVITNTLMREYLYWINDGASITIDGFKKLSEDEQNDIMDYIYEFKEFEEITINGEAFLLAHSIPENFKDDNLENYLIEEIIYGRFDYHKKYSSNRTIIVGHTPTILIDDNSKGRIFKGENLYNVDCGAFAGFPLGCLCLETKKEFYSY